jgi:hypothetical protein
MSGTGTPSPEQLQQFQAEARRIAQKVISAIEHEERYTALTAVASVLGAGAAPSTLTRDQVCAIVVEAYDRAKAAEASTKP